MKGVCAIDGCGRSVQARGWCDKHLRRWYRHGDPLGGGTPKDGTVREYFDNVVIPYAGDDCLIWPFARYAGGYGKMSGNDGSTLLVHREACRAKHGPPPEDQHEMQAAHNCGNGHLGCCNPNHLRWDTCAGNAADRLQHGTHNRGERHPHAKLTEDDVREIRALEGAVSQVKLAERFNVTTRNIRAIHRRRIWAWLDAANDNQQAGERAA